VCGEGGAKLPVLLPKTNKGGSVSATKKRHQVYGCVAFLPSRKKIKEYHFFKPLLSTTYDNENDDWALIQSVMSFNFK
jgi:hypothetical protein